MLKASFPAPGSRPLKPSIYRAVALFLGGFCLLNLLGALFLPNFDANLWWIDLRFLPPLAANLYLFALGLALVNFALRGSCPEWQRKLTLVLVGLGVLVAIENVIQFYVVWAQGKISTSMPVPFSALIGLGLGGIFSQQFKKPDSDRVKVNIYAFACALLACAVIFPLAQIFCFGKTDYQRPADVIIVFGARTYADGQPSDALVDRVRTACSLYQSGLAKTIIMSGGPGNGAVHETEAMRRLALNLGVPESAMILDTVGVSTRATVRNTARMFSATPRPKILAVSHFYHLPRIKMAYQRAGIEVYTVPAKESYFLRQMPYFILRELPGLWFYYLRPFWV